MSTGKRAMRNYEAVVVVDPRLDESAISQAVDRFTKVIGSKGEVTRLDRWGRRRLAYEINHLSGVGNLTRDPELRYTPSGAAVAKFGLAVNRSYTNRNGEKVEDTSFF